MNRLEVFDNNELFRAWRQRGGGCVCKRRGKVSARASVIVSEQRALVAWTSSCYGSLGNGRATCSLVVSRHFPRPRFSCPRKKSWYAGVRGENRDRCIGADAPTWSRVRVTNEKPGRRLLQFKSGCITLSHFALRSTVSVSRRTFFSHLFFFFAHRSVSLCRRTAKLIFDHLTPRSVLSELSCVVITISQRLVNIVLGWTVPNKISVVLPSLKS